MEDKMNLTNKQNKSVKERKIINLLKLILVDNEINIDKILQLTPITISTLKKYLEEKEELLKYITEEQIELLNKRFNYILYLKERKDEMQEFITTSKIIDDILNTRHTLEYICEKNLMGKDRFQNLFNKTNYLKERFEEATVERVINKMKENSLIRKTAPKDKIIVEEKRDIYYIKEGIYYLSSSDLKKLKYATAYLDSGFNLDYVLKSFDVHVQSALIYLSDPKLEELLKPKYFTILKRSIELEKLLVENNLRQKKLFFNQIAAFLIENDYDKYLTSLEFQIPVQLLNKILNQIIYFSILDEDIKNKFKKLLDVEKEKVEVKHVKSSSATK